MKYYELNKDTAVIMFYGYVGDWYHDGASFTALFEQLDAKYANILIRVHCYGGSVMEGVVIYNTILNSRAKVTVRVEGVAASMITQVMLAADVIEVADNAYIMVHCPSAYTDGTAKQHEAAANLLRGMESTFAQRYAEKTGQPSDKIMAWFDGTDHWFTASQAKEEGLVDAVVPSVVKNIKQLDEPPGDTDVKLVYARYAALLKKVPPKAVKVTDTANNPITNPNNLKMKKTLINLLGLAGVTEDSDDAAVSQAVAGHVTGLNNRITELETRLNQQEDAQVESLIKGVETATGKPFEAAARQQLVTVGKKAGIEALQATLGMVVPAAAPAASGKPAPPKIINMLTPGERGDERDSWTWDDYQEKAEAELEQMPTTNPEKFKSLYQAKFKTTPKI